MQGRISYRDFESTVLGRRYPYGIYLPAGYEAAPSALPVLYLLHGGGDDDETNWTIKGDVRRTMDALIGTGALPPTMVVMPGHPESYWVDGQVEQAQRALVQELLPHIEQSSRAGQDRPFRMLAGNSAGGYGALNMALRHPHLFCGAALFSPAAWTPLPVRQAGARSCAQFQVGGSFDEATWIRLNWPSQLDAYAAGPWRVPLFVSSGREDALETAAVAATLCQSLEAIQPCTELHIVPGEHNWKLWRTQLAEGLRFMARYAGTRLA